MVFVLDQVIRATFQGGYGKHALYDLICWEYLLGENFKTEDLDTFLSTRETKSPYTKGEEALSLLDNQTVFERILHRWAFPSREFMAEVLNQLCYLAGTIKQLADQNIAAGKQPLLKTMYDSEDAKFFTWLQEIRKGIQSDYIQSNAKDNSFKSWEGFVNWKDAFCKENLSWSMGDAEKLDPLLVQQVFGWTAEKHLHDTSLCHHLIRYIRGFVALTSGHPDSQSTVSKILTQKVASAGNTKFRWWAVFRCNEHDKIDAHQVNSAHRVQKLHLASAHGVQDYLIDVINAKFIKREKLDWENFVNGLWVSGYQPKVLSDALVRLTAKFHHKGLNASDITLGSELGQGRPDYVDEKGTIIGFSKVVDEFIHKGNWDEIARYVQGTRKTKEPAPERARVERAQVVDDKVPQPVGVKAGEPEAAVEAKNDETSVLPLVALAGGILAFVAIRSR